MAEIVQPRIYGVAEINFYLREYLAEDEFLSQLAVRGEISGYRAHSSGHIYCSIKEQDSSIKTIMFRSFANKLTWQPKDGDQVVIIGRISLYEKDGTCQLYAEEMFPVGDGEDALAQEKLKLQLEQEGVFAPENKKVLPKYALNIAVITSKEGAAWADIQRVAFSRNPNLQLVLYPTLVQGESAENNLIAALTKADSHNHDLIIIGRGGGANEDLSAFNQERVVGGIFQANTPIIAAIGHESDFTLSDLAADISAATPSHAAMLAVTDIIKLKNQIDDMQFALSAAMERYLVGLRNQLDSLDVRGKTQLGLNKVESRLALAITRLETLSPLATLKRGYALAYAKQGELIKTAQQVEKGDRIDIYPALGKISAVVEDNEYDE